MDLLALAKHTMEHFPDEILETMKRMEENEDFRYFAAGIFTLFMIQYLEEKKDVIEEILQ